MTIGSAVPARNIIVQKILDVHFKNNCYQQQVTLISLKSPILYFDMICATVTSKFILLSQYRTLTPCYIWLGYKILTNKS